MCVRCANLWLICIDRDMPTLQSCNEAREIAQKLGSETVIASNFGIRPRSLWGKCERQETGNENERWNEKWDGEMREIDSDSPTQPSLNSPYLGEKGGKQLNAQIRSIRRFSCQSIRRVNCVIVCEMEMQRERAIRFMSKWLIAKWSEIKMKWKRCGTLKI